jgi:uncharacterized protein
MDDLFLPDAHWQRLPAVAVVAHRVNSLLLNVAFWGAVTLGAWLVTRDSSWAAITALATAGFGLAWTIWRVVRAGRWVRAFGYREGERDLLITQGLWSKSLTAIPYGRMLSVEVTTLPTTRVWGLASVELITASSGSNAQIPALTASEAARLRDQLILLGEAQALPT